MEMYAGTRRIIARYWKAYGGLNAVVGSPYFRAACVLTAVTYGSWIDKHWWDQVLAILPNLMGFSLGAIAIFIGIGSESFRRLISRRREAELDVDSPFLKTTATFAHFVLVQTAAILVALIAAGLDNEALRWRSPGVVLLNELSRWALSAIGYTLFLYALCLVAAAVLSIFRVATWVERYQQGDDSTKGGSTTAE